ncbi:hypothetical protein NIES4073_23320 [Kalymmatonema gypsitolerans NIES-4073]|nr:hypothetical protein NIES4073_23320 [Scytonema sp. NIES-4073]
MPGLRDSLCRKSSLTLAILLEIFATNLLALRRLFEVLSVFLASLRCLRFLFNSCFANCFLGKSYLEPSEVMAKLLN